MNWRLFVLVASVAAGCTSDGYPGPKQTRPTPPDQNDPAFTAHALQSWYLVGDGVTPGDDQMTAIITAPAGAKYVDAYVADLPPVRMIDQDDGFAMQFSIADLAPGDYTILFTKDGSDTAFAQVAFHRSKPFYVLVSTDYDFSDPGTYATGYMDWLHRDHPGMRITHFWAPYTYTDPVVTDARRGELDTWIKMQRDQFHDEIGLHIHPYCNFVVDAGLTCITDQSDVYPLGDTSGYTIMLGAYGRDNLGVLLAHAKDLFAQHGLGTPDTFRAGGWTATLDTLFALQDNGYIADTSALNWQYIQKAWMGKVIASWNMQQWMPINDTSQPYYPSMTAITETHPGQNLSLLEVPDNGVMIDYVTLDDMHKFFDENFTGTALTAPRTLMMGFHPATGFTQAEYQRVDGFLDYADMHLATKDQGPVVYTTLHDVTPAFPSAH